MKKTLFRLLAPTVLVLAAQLALAQPGITSISPSSALAGGSGFTVTVTGVNFVPSTAGLTIIPGSQVLWNGSLRPTGFVSPTQLQASITTNDIASPGTADVSVVNPGGVTSNTVTFTIIAANPIPTITSLSPASATVGGAAFSLTVDGSSFVAGAVVRWNGGDRSTTFVGSSRLTASISAADIATAGTAEVTVINPSPGGGGSGVATFAIIAGGAAQLEVLPAALNFQAGGSTPAIQNLRIGNSGGGFVSWTAQVSTTRGGNWLSLSTASGSAAGLLPSQVQVAANPANLAPGVYSGAITVRDTVGGNSIAVTVIFYVVPAAPILQVSHTGLRFSAPLGGVTTPAQSFTVLNSGPGTLNWTIETSTLSGGPWLTVSATSGTSISGSTFPAVSVSANPTGLGVGAYYGEIRVVSGAVNSPQSINVVLSVVAGAVETQINPQGVLFVARAGSAAPLPQTVNVAGATALSATVSLSTSSGGSWLDAQPRTLAGVAGTGGTLTLSASPGALQPGVYRGTVSLAFSDNTTQTISVLLLVASAAEAVPASAPWRSDGGSAATCVPLRLLAVTRILGGNFTSSVGWPRTIEVQAADDCGNLANGATVVASFSNGDPPLVLAGLGNGLYSATWKPGSASDQTTVTIRATQGALQEATLQAQGKVAANPGVPLVGSGGVVNAASFANGQPMAPGSIISVFGVRIADSTPGAASALPLPTTLAGSSVVVGGVTAPLFYSSSGQINAQIPFEIPANTRLGVFVQLSIPGSLSLSLPETIAVDTARPGIFLAGVGSQGVVIDTQGRLVNSGAPAAAGDVLVVYCTGLGATVPTAPTGRPAPSNPPASVITPVGVTVGGVAAADVQFAGLTPGLVGLYQVNVKIPPGVAAGAAVPLIISQNGVPSNTVTIAMR